jgi:hypothetical protein
MLSICEISNLSYITRCTKKEYPETNLLTYNKEGEDAPQENEEPVQEEKEAPEEPELEAEPEPEPDPEPEPESQPATTGDLLVPLLGYLLHSKKRHILIY